MTTTDAVTPIRISGPDGLLAIVPTMLGFHPANSLVLICLSGRRRRVGPVARVDLTPSHDRALAAHLAGHAVEHADEVAVVVYQDRRRRPPLLSDVLAALNSSGVAVLDAIEVRAGRAYPALRTGPKRVEQSFAVPGSEDPQMQVLTAAAAMSGRTVLPHRDALRQSIAAPTGRRLRTAERSITAAARGALPHGAGSTEAVGNGGPVHASDHRSMDVLGLFEAALEQVAASGGVEVGIAAALTVWLTDELVRDTLLALAVNELERPWLPMLISCATWTPPSLSAPLCSVLAVVAYRHGDGALAQVALDRCLDAEPDHPLANMTIAMISAGMRPEAMGDLANSPPIDDVGAELP